MQNFATLALIYHWLLVLHIELLQPVVVAEIWVREQKLAPLGNVVVAHGSSVGAAVLLLFYREHKVKVAVNELVHLHARRARTTGIARSRVAQEIARKSHRKRQFTVARRAGKEQGVGHTVLIDTLFKLLDNLFLAYYVTERRTAHQYIAFAISQTLSTAFIV